MLLYPFQEKTVRRALEAPLHRLGIAMEMGLGKTPVALSICDRVFAGRAIPPRVLVVTPSIVKEHWLEETARWWPTSPAAAAISMGKGRVSGVSKAARERRDRAYLADFQVVSYALLKHVDRGPWDAIIFDEAHRLKKPSSIQSRQAREIAEANPGAMILPLTATPMPDEICDIWNLCDITWPGRFGSTSSLKYQASYSFATRYSVWREAIGPDGTVFGGKFSGLNPVHAEELRRRLLFCWDRVTKAEVAHLLPPFLVQLQKVEPAKQIKFNNIDDWLQRQGEAKFPFVQEWMEDAVETNTHICVLTHLRASAGSIATFARSFGMDVFEITGDETPEARNAKLKAAKALPRAIIVATMHSVGIGIDLTFATAALFAELYWRPETVIQALGRFSRLSGKLPSSCTLLCLQGTIDETIARSLMRKIEDISRVVGAGDSEEKALASLASLKLSDDQAVDMLNQALFADGLLEVF